jgi:hypothetical protein
VRQAWGKIAVAEAQRRERMAQARKLRDREAHPQLVGGAVLAAREWNGLIRQVRRELTLSGGNQAA